MWMPFRPTNTVRDADEEREAGQTKAFDQVSAAVQRMGSGSGWVTHLRRGTAHWAPLNDARGKNLSVSFTVQERFRVGARSGLPLQSRKQMYGSKQIVL